MPTFSIYSIFSIFLNIEYIEESILKNSIFSICIENIDRGSSIPNTPLVAVAGAVAKIIESYLQTATAAVAITYNKLVVMLRSRKG